MWRGGPTPSRHAVGVVALPLEDALQLVTSLRARIAEVRPGGDAADFRLHLGSPILATAAAPPEMHLAQLAVTRRGPVSTLA